MTRLSVMLALVVALGVVGFASLDRTPTTGWVAEGDLWHAESPTGELLKLPVGAVSLPMPAGTRLVVHAPEGAATVSAFTLEGSVQDAAARVRIGRPDGQRWLVVDGAANAWCLALDDNGEATLLDHAVVAARADGSFSVRVRWQGQRLTADVNGVPALGWDDEGQGSVIVADIVGGTALLRRLELVGGGELTADTMRAERELAGHPVSAHPKLKRVLGALGIVLAVWVLMVLAGSAVTCAPTLAWVCCLWVLAPLAAGWCVAAVTHAPLPELANWLLVVLGSGLSVTWAHRRHRKIGSPEDGMPRDGEPPSDARQGNSVLLGDTTFRAATWLGIGALLALAVLVVERRHAALAPVHAAEQQARALSLPANAVRTEPMTLGPDNALVFEGPYHDVSVRASVTLADNAALLVRLRAADVDLPVGLSFVLSADAQRRTGWVREEASDYEPLGNSAPPVSADREHRLELRARGRTLQALIDGREVARVESDAQAAGGVVLLTAPGRATLGELRIEAHPPGPAPSDTWRLVLGPLAVLALAVGLAIGLWATSRSSLRRAERKTSGPRAPPAFDKGLSPTRSLALAGWALAPLGIALLTVGADGRLDGAVVLRSAAITVLAVGLAALLATAMAAPMARMQLRATLVLVVLAGLAVPWGLPHAVAPRERADRTALNELRSTAWHGSRLHDHLLHLEHPLFRRFGFYLARHAFRGRTYALPKPDGVRRVAALGGSSTWGYRLGPEAAWPAQLQERLAVASDNNPVEVINAGIQASIGNRLLRWLRDVVMDFEPDVVVLSLTFNDSFALSRADEEAYLAQVTTDGFERSSWSRLRARHVEDRGRAGLRRLLDAFAREKHELTSAQLWERLQPVPDVAPPPERFADMLFRFADLCAAHDVALVLVQEPVRDNATRLWKEEFHAVMKQVGQQRDLTVIDPWPALQAAAAERGPMFLDGIHLTAAGHAVMAEALEEALELALRER